MSVRFTYINISVVRDCLQRTWTICCTSMAACTCRTFVLQMLL